MGNGEWGMIVTRVTGGNSVNNQKLRNTGSYLRLYYGCVVD